MAPKLPTRYLSTLREQSGKGPGRGLKRFARFARGGIGLARATIHRGDPTRALDESDLRRVEALVKRLGELKGLPMKLGQIMSYLELELPEEARQLMSLLQTQSAATPLERVQAIIREDLGSRSASLLSSLEPEPISIASIGQVHRARLPDGSHVAVKVRHPDIRAAIESDFRVARRGGGLAGFMVPGMGATVRDFMEEIEARLLEECDYGLEAQRQQRFAALFANHPAVLIPAVQAEWSGPRVLTTAWQSGTSFDEFRSSHSQEERDRAGEALFNFYIGSLYRHGIFHADPHPGNYQFQSDGKVIIFDFGCVREFEPHVTHAFVALAQAVRSDDRDSICEALRRLGASPSEHDDTYERLRSLLRSFFAPMLASGPQQVDARMVVNMGQVMRDKMALMRLRLPGRLTFLFRIRFGLYAVLSRLGARCDWASLEQKFSSEAFAADVDGSPRPTASGPNEPSQQ